MKKKQYISAILLVFSSFFALATDGTVKDEKKSGDLKKSPDQINLFLFYLVEQAHSVVISGGGN